MKQTYYLHSRKNIKSKKDDLISITVDEVGECPCCGIATSPTFINGCFIEGEKSFSPSIAFVILYCPSCHQFYIAKYCTLPCQPIFNNMVFVETYPHPMATINFDECISEISPEFVKLYKQANYAEASPDTMGLAGLGYRKALEFLIKDYLINVKHEDKEKIITLSLGKCVNKLDKSLQDIAKASVWLGNDEVHYFKKHEDYGIEHLKKFINCLVSDIVSEHTKNEAKELIDSNK